jgi:hypothetical protein
MCGFGVILFNYNRKILFWITVELFVFLTLESLDLVILLGCHRYFSQEDCRSSIGSVLIFVAAWSLLFPCTSPVLDPPPKSTARSGFHCQEQVRAGLSDLDFIG